MLGAKRLYGNSKTKKQAFYAFALTPSMILYVTTTTPVCFFTLKTSISSAQIKSVPLQEPKVFSTGTNFFSVSTQKCS